MSAYSTETTTRNKAIRKIIQKVNAMSNQELADLLFEVHGREVLHNYIIENDEPEENDDL